MFALLLLPTFERFHLHWQGGWNVGLLAQLYPHMDFHISTEHLLEIHDSSSQQIKRLAIHQYRVSPALDHIYTSVI